MFARIISYLLILIIFSCSDKSEFEEEPTPIIPELSLISPLDIITENRNIEFEWQSNLPSIHYLSIDTIESFDDPLIIDSIFTSNPQEYLLTNSLAPNTQFYWKINVDTIESTGSFETVDLISQFEGEYQVLVNYQYSDDDGFFDIDTTYESILEVIKVDNKFQLYEETSFSGEILYFWENPWDVNRLSYENIISPWHHEVRLNLHLVNDTISASKSQCGLGCESDWVMRGVKIE